MIDKLIDNFEGLSEEEMSEYAGEWIAIVDGRVVAHGNSFKDVYEYAKNNYPKNKALIGKLPDAMPTILSIN